MNKIHWFTLKSNRKLVQVNGKTHWLWMDLTRLNIVCNKHIRHTDVAQSNTSFWSCSHIVRGFKVSFLFSFLSQEELKGHDWLAQWHDARPAGGWAQRSGEVRVCAGLHPCRLLQCSVVCWSARYETCTVIPINMEALGQGCAPLRTALRMHLMFEKFHEKSRCNLRMNLRRIWNGTKLKWNGYFVVNYLCFYSWITQKRWFFQFHAKFPILSF